MIGKPYSGKPNVRFDEGELEIEPSGYYASSLLYCYQVPAHAIFPQFSSAQFGLKPALLLHQP
jgi:hypothetical protein